MLRGLLLAALLALACSPDAVPKHLVLVTIDTLRRDALGAYGGEDVSPNIDRLARTGIRFDDALAQAISTPASHASMLTGRNPPGHGLRRLWGERLSDENDTLAEILRRAGFTTAAFVSAVPLRAELGIDQGFDHYDASFAAGRSERRAAETNERVREWLGSRPEGRTFLWVHYFDPHAPYFAPAAERSRFGVGKVRRSAVSRSRNLNPDTGNADARPPDDLEIMSALYTAEVHYADSAVGELLSLLEEQDVLGQAIVALVSDHGECLGEHGYYYGHWDVFAETARIPMILRHPAGRFAGRVVSAPVGTIDLLPTLLAWLEIDPPEDLDGIDLTPLVRGEEPPERALYTEQVEYFRARAARDGHWMLLDRPHAGTSRETRLVPRRPDDALPVDPTRRVAVEARLRDRLRNTTSGPRHAPERIELSEEIREALRALGYSD